MKATKIIGVAVLILIGVGLLPPTRDALKWHFASSGDKTQDYAEYLAAWPDGRHAAEARSRYDERSWADAQAGKTLESYRHYEQTHPSGTHLAEARTRIEDLTWQQSTNTDSIQSLEAYLKSYDTGRFAAAARTRIEDLAWQQSTNANTVQSVEAYLKSYNTGRFAAAARTRIEDLTWQQSTNANTIRSLRTYAQTYPQGRFLAESQTRQEALRLDERPFTTALSRGSDVDPLQGRKLSDRTTEEQKNRMRQFAASSPAYQEKVRSGIEAALKEFLTEFPGHTKEAEAQQALKDMSEGRDIVDLVNEKKIEVQTQGSGIRSVSVRVRRLVPYPFTIRIPVGTYFVSANQSSQNMVTTAESKQTLTTDSWVSLSPAVACANRPRDIPGSKDSFSVQRSPHQEELARLMPVLDKAGVPYATRQAAVWIVTDNASYADLGILVSRSQYQFSGGSRTIREGETARAMKICTDAGIDVTRKRIWSDRQTILRGLNDADLKKWLEEKQ
jgi:hypothetical protein